jgi:nucleoside 2-deoxyribosyltransferase
MRDGGIKMTKFYIASSFSLKEKVLKLAKALEEEGHEVIHDWWNFDYKTIDLPDNEWYRHPKVTGISLKNFSAIDKADGVILVAPDQECKKFNGANIEVGYALAQGKEVLSVGVLERSAMYVPVNQYATIEDLINDLWN